MIESCDPCAKLGDEGVEAWTYEADFIPVCRWHHFNSWEEKVPVGVNA